MATDTRTVTVQRDGRDIRVEFKLHRDEKAHERGDRYPIDVWQVASATDADGVLVELTMLEWQGATVLLQEKRHGTH